MGRAVSAATTVRPPARNEIFGHAPLSADTEPDTVTGPDGRPSSLTVTVKLATARLPLLADVLEFGSTTYVNWPLPEPLDPLWIEIQLAFDLADQVHPACVFTLTVPAPPVASKD